MRAHIVVGWTAGVKQALANDDANLVNLTCVAVPMAFMHDGCLQYTAGR
jgi:hypothetical protein